MLSAAVRAQEFPQKRNLDISDCQTSINIKNQEKYLIGIGGGDNKFIMLINALTECMIVSNKYNNPRTNTDDRFAELYSDYMNRDEYVIGDNIRLIRDENLKRDGNEKTFEVIIKCLFKLDNISYIYESTFIDKGEKYSHKANLTSSEGLVFNYQSTSSFTNSMYEDLKAENAYKLIVSELETNSYLIEYDKINKLTSVYIAK